MPFRTAPQSLLLPEGYSLEMAVPTPAELDPLIVACGDPSRSADRWVRALERSDWMICVRNGVGQLVGFLRATSDQALNINLWNLAVHPAEASRGLILQVMVQQAMTRMRQETPGCSVSAAPPLWAVEALQQNGFVLDPVGIRAMGLRLQP